MLTRRDIVYLRKWHGKVPLEVLAETLDVSPLELGRTLVELGIMSTAAPNGRRRWTNDEDKKLVADWGKIPIGQIALELGRSPVAVQIRASILFLSTRKRKCEKSDTGAGRNAVS